MNIRRAKEKIRPVRWARFMYNLTMLPDNKSRVSGCDEHIALSRKCAQEGMVLLENNGALPLKEGSTVALFGVGTLEYIKGGGGSGQVYPEYVRNIYEGFQCKAPRIHIYEPLSEFYYEYAVPRIDQLEDKQILPEPEIPISLLASAAKAADVAIISIHRYSGEEWDRRAEKGDFYLTDEEERLVMDVTSVFDHTVVVLNVGGMLDLSWIKSNPKIDAALMAWQAGMEGGLAIADILCGDVNPSGKLTDTFAGSFSDYPSADTFHESDDYVSYYEDIYVGYRYFETIPGAKEKVVYPFGYGLSYTTFSISKPIAKKINNNIEIHVAVKNTGSLAGREVVQVYYSAPQGQLGKSALDLAAFQKTKLLSPGASQEIVMSFPISQMSSFDDTGKCQMSAFVMEKGEYRFFVGNSCHNLQECDYRYCVGDDFVVMQQLHQYCAPNMLEKRMLSDGSFERLSSCELKQYDIPAPVNPAKEPQTDRPVPLRDVADGKISLDEFIAQMTEDELVLLVGGIPNKGVANTSGWGGVARLDVPAVMTVDGPAGVRINPWVGIPTTAWPCATLIACTWDPEIAHAIGIAGGLECKENGLGAWLTPGLNIHRNPLCGRNFEYFSEDPLISGRFAAAKVRGIQSIGIAASVKHFAANNKETNRFYSDSRMSERALREIYLRAFEICVKESSPWTVMTSYNLINSQRACESYELIEGILRGEWEFDGMVTSDWDVPCDHVNCVKAGNDIRMHVGFPDVLRKALEDGRLERGHLERCARHILGMILKLS